MVIGHCPPFAAAETDAVELPAASPPKASPSCTSAAWHSRQTRVLITFVMSFYRPQISGAVGVYDTLVIFRDLRLVIGWKSLGAQVKESRQLRRQLGPVARGQRVPTAFDQIGVERHVRVPKGPEATMRDVSFVLGNKSLQLHDIPPQLTSKTKCSAEKFSRAVRIEKIALTSAAV